MVDINPKFPKHTWDDKEIEPKYGTLHGWRGILGECSFTYSNPDEPTKYSWQKIEPTGSMETLSMDDKEGQNYTNLTIGNKFSYTTDGESSQVDGHKDSNCESTIRENCEGDIGRSGKKSHIVFTDGQVESIDKGKVSIITSASESWNASGSYGDTVNEHSGHWHESFEKDRVTNVNLNNILMVSEGDCSTHVQSGNYDAKVKEKYKVFSGNDLLIQSATKITLRVGNSSIVIEPDHIYIIANNSQSRIDLNPGGAGPGTGIPSETA